MNEVLLMGTIYMQVKDVCKAFISLSLFTTEWDWDLKVDASIKKKKEKKLLVGWSS